jgi:hypothetical protein
MALEFKYLVHISLLAQVPNFFYMCLCAISANATGTRNIPCSS